jgi:hypothetical protein
VIALQTSSPWIRRRFIGRAIDKKRMLRAGPIHRFEHGWILEVPRQLRIVRRD